MINVPESEEIALASGDETNAVERPHVENVRLIKMSKSHGGATGFNSDIPMFLSIGLLGLFLLGYFLFR